VLTKSSSGKDSYPDKQLHLGGGSRIRSRAISKVS